MTMLLFCLLLLPPCAIGFLLDECALLDLTWPFQQDTVYWPGAPSFVLTKTVKTSPYYAANNYSAAEHGGTHLDAPIHFTADRKSVDQLPLSDLIGEACVLDVRVQCAANADYQLTVDDILMFEAQHGTVDKCILIMYTGWEVKYPDKRRYLGNRFAGDADDLHFPGLHPAAADWLVQKRNIKAFGMDTASLDYGPSKNFDSHRIFTAANLYNLENLMNLGRLPPRGATLIVAPQKITGDSQSVRVFSGTGAPARVYAIGHEANDPCSRRATAAAVAAAARPAVYGDQTFTALTAVALLALYAC